MLTPKAQRSEEANVIQKLRLIFLSLSISGIAKAGSFIPFINTNTNEKYVCYVRLKQASVKR